MADGTEKRQPDLVNGIVEARIAGETTVKDAIDDLVADGVIAVRDQKEGRSTVHYLRFAENVETVPG